MLQYELTLPVECEVIPHRHLVARRTAAPGEDLVWPLSQQVAALLSPDLAPPPLPPGSRVVCAVTTPLGAPSAGAVSQYSWCQPASSPQQALRRLQLG